MYTAPSARKRASSDRSSPIAVPFSTAGTTASTPSVDAASICPAVAQMRAVTSPTVPPIEAMVSSIDSARDVAAAWPSAVRGPCGT